MATGLFLQKRQEGDIPRDEHTESLSVAVSRQDAVVHVEADSCTVLCHEVRVVSARHADMLDDDRES